jgi:lysophospholipase L1-like esterase
MRQGLRLSILGDSISTYRDISNNPLYNATLQGQPYFYRPVFPCEKTYWWRVMDTLGLTLCVNNSWSGGNLSGVEDETSGVNRARYLTNEQGEAPDIVLVFMGINDLGRGVDATVFAADYGRTLETIKGHYPTAKVCCVNLPDRDPSFLPRTVLFNEAIEAAVARCGENFFVADLFHSHLNNDFYYMNTLDGLHPDEDGMGLIAETVEDAIRKHIP